MNHINSKWMVILILTIGTVIGIMKGSGARQKWVFKIKNRFQEKRQVAEQKRMLRSGYVPLDDIELAAFHN